MQKVLNKLFSSLILISIFACGGANKVLISNIEIDAAQRDGRLESLYNKASSMIDENSGKTKKEAITIRSKIVKLLVDEKNNEVNTRLNQFEKQQTNVTRENLLDLKSSIASMQQWSATNYARLSLKVNGAIKQINQSIRLATEEANEIGKDQIASIFAFKRAANLAGKSQPEYEVYIEENKKALNQFQHQGNDALSKRLFNTAIASAKAGLMLDPGSIQFESMLSQAQAGLFEKDFRFALENGKPESAYQLMLTVVDNPIFLQLKKTMYKSILLLANYFSGSAQQAYKKNDMLTAYSNFVKGRYIQEKLNIAQKGFIQEKKFLDMLMKKSKQSDLAEGNRQVLMRIVSEFDAYYPSLKSELLKVNDFIKKRAMTKISIADFKEVPSQSSVVASVGRRIASKLEKLLFEKLGNEVKIVTDIKPEQRLVYDGLSLKIDGEILQAAIESSTNVGKRSQIVQTSVNRVETEAYKKWSKRKKGDVPKRYNETPVNEEVTLSIEHIRKQAIAEVAFRIIEPINSTLLLTDNFVKESEFNGESINEFQKGHFHQPYVRADLPSDIKIMDSLASELALNLGDKLAEYLKNPEQIFYQKATDAMAQGNKAVSIELFANAIAIGEGKGKDVTLWYDEVKQLVLQ